MLAIDQGTSGTTVLAIDRDLAMIGKNTVPVTPSYPRSGWVEHDLDGLWRSTTTAISGLIEGGLDPARVAAIGVTNQRETVGIWERKTGLPLAPAIVWQCRRTAARMQALLQSGEQARIQAKTGLVLDPYFSASKGEWLLEHVEGARARAERGEVVLGTVDTFLVQRLTANDAVVTDPSNASRTMLYDLNEGHWDPELCDLFRIPRAALAEIRSSSEVVGTTRDVPGLPDGIPIAGIAGDQQAALFGQACFERGDAKCTYGTGAFLLVHTGTEPVRSRERLLTTVAWRLGPNAPIEYALEGSVFCAGAALAWLRDGLGIIGSMGDLERLARTVPESGDVVFVPALTGLGAPHWRPEARGLLAGLSRDTGPGHIARAAIEGVALECDELFSAIERDAGPLGAVKIDGGAASNDLLLETQATLVKRPVVRPHILETTGAGAAFLAGLAVGLFSSKAQIRESWRAARVVEPGPSTEADALREKWKRAVPRA